MPVVARSIAADPTFGPDVPWHPHLQHQKHRSSYAYFYGRRFQFPKLLRRQFAHHGCRDQSPQCEDPLQQVHRLLLLDPYVLPGPACTLFAPDRTRVKHMLKKTRKSSQTVVNDTGRRNGLTRQQIFGVPQVTLASRSRRLQT
jgi:hypothetical protein